jgi:hypothetical protein
MIDSTVGVQVRLGVHDGIAVGAGKHIDQGGQVGAVDVAVAVEVSA